MRYALRDTEWKINRPILPSKPRGVRRVNDRRVLNGIFWVLRSGASWRDLPERCGPCTTCYNRFVRRRRAGAWDRILERLFNRIKHCRRVATRYDKLAANYLAFIKLACMIDNAGQMKKLVVGGYVGVFSFEPFAAEVHKDPNIAASLAASRAYLSA